MFRCLGLASCSLSEVFWEKKNERERKWEKKRLTGAILCNRDYTIDIFSFFRTPLGDIN